MICLDGLMIHSVSIAISFAQFLFYVTFNSLLQYVFYYKREKSLAWKIRADLPVEQVEGDGKGKQGLARAWDLWWFPLKWVFSRPENVKPNRHPYHVYLGTFNLLLSSCFAGVVCELVIAGKSSLGDYESFFPTTWVYSESNNYSLLWLLRGWFLSMMMECAMEYYWHRVMHTPFFYRHMHKIHHYYKSPQPFDDMMIHPFEAIGYYFILYSPTMLIDQPLSAFLLYMAVMGSAGVLDHSGIVVDIPYIYTTRDHDEHHRLFNVNYAFPFPQMDMIHGTHFKRPLTK